MSVAPSVLHLSTYAGGGGAGRAALALHRAMESQGIDSELWTAHGTRFKIAKELDRRLWSLQRSDVSTWRSPARFGSLSARDINNSGADIVNLHWVTDGFLSIEEIGRINKPIVWSLYDMWAFCGTEHYGVDRPDARWRDGYMRNNRPPNERGFDLDRYTWERKKRHWRPGPVVPASSWLAQAVADSALMGSWPSTRIPHVVDTDVFSPSDPAEARESLGVSGSAITILFLASAGIHDRRKGWDLLIDALPIVTRGVGELTLLVAGPPAPDAQLPPGVSAQWLGQLQGDAALRNAYSAADVVAVPSREDNMPLTAMEAQTCGRAVVGFDIGGMPDIVDHGRSGYLARTFENEKLAQGLIKAVAEARAADAWGPTARTRALETWSGPVVVDQYIDVYGSALA